METVEERLQRIRDNFISLNTFEEVCRTEKCELYFADYDWLIQQVSTMKD